MGALRHGSFEGTNAVGGAAAGNGAHAGWHRVRIDTDQVVVSTRTDVGHVHTRARIELPLHGEIPFLGCGSLRVGLHSSGLETGARPRRANLLRDTQKKRRAQPRRAAPAPERGGSDAAADVTGDACSAPDVRHTQWYKHNPRTPPAARRGFGRRQRWNAASDAGSAASRLGGPAAR